jgi:hypothetical protein
LVENEKGLTIIWARRLPAPPEERFINTQTLAKQKNAKNAEHNEIGVPVFRSDQS